MKSRTIRLIFFASVLSAGLSASAFGVESEEESPETGIRQSLSVSDIVSSYELYDGKLITLNACLNVTTHGMSFIDCGTKGGRQIMFDIDSRSADKGYQNILAAGFEVGRMESSKVSVMVSGRLHVRREEYPLFRLSLQEVHEICRHY